jgi:hypothetical protein
MTAVLLLIAFLLEAIASISTYRLRRVLFHSFPNNYETIGYREADGAYRDSIKTIFRIPWGMSTEGLPPGIVAKIKWLRVHRVLFFLIVIPAFLSLAGE